MIMVLLLLLLLRLVDLTCIATASCPDIVCARAARHCRGWWSDERHDVERKSD